MAWENEYRDKLRTAAEAVELIPDGSLVVQGNAVGEPPALLHAVADRARSGGLSSLRMTSLLPMGASAQSILAPDVQDVINWESIFASGADRKLITDGVAVYTPAFFHQVPRLYTEFMDVNVALICVSRVDKHGYMSLGTNVDTNKAAIAAADVVLAEVNPNMPRVHGDSWVHVSEVDALVEHEAPLTELPVPPEREEDVAMGQLIAEMIPNGATNPARHRRRAERRREVAHGAPGPGHPHRDVRRLHGRSGRNGRRQRLEEDVPPRQGPLLIRRGLDPGCTNSWTTTRISRPIPSPT